MKILKDESDKTAIWTIAVLAFIVICLIIAGILYSPKPESTNNIEKTEEPTGIKEEPKREALVSNNDSIKKLIKVG